MLLISREQPSHPNLVPRRRGLAAVPVAGLRHCCREDPFLLRDLGWSRRWWRRCEDLNLKLQVFNQSVWLTEIACSWAELLGHKFWMRPHAQRRCQDSGRFVERCSSRHWHRARRQTPTPQHPTQGWFRLGGPPALAVGSWRQLYSDGGGVGSLDSLNRERHVLQCCVVGLLYSESHIFWLVRHHAVGGELRAVY